MDYPRIAQRLFNRPLAIQPEKAAVILQVLAPRLGIGRVRLPGGAWMTPADLMADLGLQAQADRPAFAGGRTFEMSEGIAYIPVIGTLVNKLGTLDPESGMTGYDGIAVKHEAAMADDAVRGILFDLETPGGEVDGLFELTDRIFRSNARNGGKTTVAVAGDYAASAGYAIAAAADFVFLPETGEVGSIGVATMHADFSKALAQDGIDVTLIFSGAHKVDGNPFEPLPDPVRAEIAGKVARVYELFVADIGRMRAPMTADQARATEARVYMGADAVTAGLADGVATPSEVFAAFIEEMNP